MGDIWAIQSVCPICLGRFELEVDTWKLACAKGAVTVRRLEDWLE
jgi:hypothetical protein